MLYKVFKSKKEITPFIDSLEKKHKTIVNIIAITQKDNFFTVFYQYDG